MNAKDLIMGEKPRFMFPKANSSYLLKRFDMPSLQGNEGSKAGSMEVSNVSTPDPLLPKVPGSRQRKE